MAAIQPDDRLANKTNGVTNGSGDAVRITDDEAALYDRQIRLWGVDAQRKLRSCNVLLVGLSGVGSEIAKNIVLAGINSLTVVDSTTISEHDSLSNIFTYNHIGGSRAKVAEAHIRALNPMVSVTAHDLDIKQLLAEKDTPRLLALLENVHVVCVTAADKGVAIQLNNLARSLNRKIKFYWANCWGFYGFSFTDLGKGHTYVVEDVTTSSDDTVVLDGEPAAKRVKQDKEEEKKYVEKTLDYPTLEAALAIRAGKVGYGLTKRVNPVFLLTHVMLAFHEKYGRFPENRQVDSPSLEAMQQEIVEQKLGLDEAVTTKLKALEWWNNVYGEISPIASIVGAVVGQDIIRAVSEKETPVKNFFVFNGMDCNGVIESIGK